MKEIKKYINGHVWLFSMIILFINEVKIFEMRNFFFGTNACADTHTHTKVALYTENTTMLVHFSSCSFYRDVFFPVID